MAKFCFYCGRELAGGERCHCKDSGAYTSKSSNNGTSQGGSGYAYQTATQTGSATGDVHSRYKAPGIFMRIKSYFYKKQRQLHTFKDQVRTGFPGILPFLMGGVRYLTRPAIKIRQESMKSKRAFSIPFLVIFSLLSGLIAYLMIHSGTTLFSSFLTQLLGPDLAYLYAHPAVSFLAMTVLSALLIGAMCLAFYVALRFQGRKATFRKIIDLVSISIIYLFIVELLMLVGQIGGGPGSLSLLLLGLLVMVIANFLSFRTAFNLTEDAAFSLLGFVYLFCFFLFKVVLFVGSGLLNALVA